MYKCDNNVPQWRHNGFTPDTIHVFLYAVLCENRLIFQIDLRNL